MTEKQNIEWKRNWKDEYLKTICAFANTAGGKLTIGLDDSAAIIGVSDSKSILEDIPSKIVDRLGIVSIVNLLEKDGKDIIEITVQAYTNAISYRGKYYIRSGSTTRELNGLELTDFLLTKSGKTWDEIIVDNATMSDIDPDAIKKLITDSKGTGRLPDTDGLTDLEIMQKLRLAVGNQIKRSGIILFGKDPNQFTPNCKVKIGRFGTDSSDLLHHEELEGNIMCLLRDVPNLLNAKFLVRPVEFQGMKRVEKDLYPFIAIREILLNALVHKKYGGGPIQIRVFDDRLSIWNPGPLPAGLSIESLKQDHNSIPSNPLIADACFKAGYIEAWGLGTLKIYRVCKETGLPEPQIIEKDGGIEVSLFSEDPSEKLRRNFLAITEKISNDTERNLEVLTNEYGAFIDYVALENGISSEKLRRSFGENEKEFRSAFGENKALLLFLIVTNPEISAVEAAKKVGVSDRTIESYFAQLKETILKRIGPDKGGYWKIIINR